MSITVQARALQVVTFLFESIQLTRSLYGVVKYIQLCKTSKNWEGVLCEMRIAEFRKGVFCGISNAEHSANYSLEFSRNLHSAKFK